ncbi:MAG: purine/pyrimidine permease [Alistipes sp.]|nr:purine/pyrimidine permease [Alistipes sp.]MBO7264738.1 purine/pyrimidine permease [Alistipes sp.]
MKLKYNVDDRLPAAQMMIYALQWFILAVAVVVTSVFVAQGTPGEKIFYSQKLFALIGVAGLVQVIWGHRLPIIAGPASVLLVGVLSALGSKASTEAIYTSIAIGGAIITLLTFGGLMRHVQRLFTPRIVVVILMLIAVTLAPVIKNLVFPVGAEHGVHLFGLIFALVGSIAMVVLNRTLKGVAKSLAIPIALVVGSVAYYALFPVAEFTPSAASFDGLLLSGITLDWGVIVAFLICYIALLINDIGSIESLGGMLQSQNMDSRTKRGVRLTGIMNIVAGSLGVLGPVNYSMSPGVIASTRCASRYALIPAALLLILCAFSDRLIWILTLIPNPVIGVILLFLMGTQLAASLEMLHSTRSVTSFSDGLTIGLPLMVAMLFQLMPRGIAPQIIEPLISNGFAMGVIVVILLEHVVNRAPKTTNGDKVS